MEDLPEPKIKLKIRLRDWVIKVITCNSSCGKIESNCCEIKIIHENNIENHDGHVENILTIPSESQAQRDQKHTKSV